MTYTTKWLQKQLTAAGAEPSEAADLAGLASNLSYLKASKPQWRGFHGWRLASSLGFTAVFGLVLGVGLVVYSQTSLPGSWLYPVQRFSDAVAVSAKPDYRGVVMMKRAQQVKQLVAEHASSQIILATLSSYKLEAAAYKTTTSNYAAFEYCKTNLQQAAAAAPNPERRAINNTVQALNNT